MIQSETRRSFVNKSKRYTALSLVRWVACAIGYSKRCSWLNQVEMWFSILVRRLLKRASFKSTDELRQRIRDLIEYFNGRLAKPLSGLTSGDHWRFSGVEYF